MTTHIRTIHCNGHEFNVTRDDDAFWDRLEQGHWEPETLAVFDHYIGPETLHVDIGSWIGPTLLYAAERARLAIGFEPDPVRRKTVDSVSDDRHLAVAYSPKQVAIRNGTQSLVPWIVVGREMGGNIKVWF